MNCMLVVVFDSEAKAYDGKKALLQLDAEGSISVYGCAVVAKNADGTAPVKQGDDAGSLGTLLGTSVRSIIDLPFWSTGFAIGATAGFASGTSADLANASVGQDFIDDVCKALSPGKVALVAEIEEDSTTPVDKLYLLSDCYFRLGQSHGGGRRSYQRRRGAARD